MSAQLKTRKPTGKPSWPILLLAGAEKAGKSYSAAVAAGSDLVGCTYWVTIGEDQPDEYGLLGDFDIVEHDGKYQSILATLNAIAAQPAPDKGVPLLVVDSMSRLWDLLSLQAQETAQRRAVAVAKKRNWALPEEEVPITMDLWNMARTRWDRVMDAIRAFPGPVILTARLDTVAVMDDKGKPVPGAKTTKVQGHKSLPFDVGAIVEMPTRGEAWLTGVRSVGVKLPERLKVPEFTVDGLWRKLGLHEAQTSARDHVAPDITEDSGPKPVVVNWDPVPWEDAVAAAGENLVALRKVWDDAHERGVLEQPISNGEPLRVFLTKVVKRAQQDAEAAA